MKKLLLTIIIIISVSVASCKKDSPAGIDYTGTWNGFYNGDGDNGTWTATIDSNGDVTGSATSAVYIQTYDLVGTIDDEGVFTATAGSASTGSEFVGQFNENDASGTWSNTTYNMSGTWTGSRSSR